ncbi:hypothetical protein DN069_20235 [Streptacidiphilus pinicola]|uniref:Uncharacterized protein n=1 Tax=Streptacidiphilus pinicola TaxID=2219663 RepID=A0A2X0J0Q0_9ACTN|nr:hypothetical protein [Streptacidiphilus pinicola]RAG83776.1 hypothetical protein DN069_20235 [Streptacidiphilus pinicola]
MVGEPGRLSSLNKIVDALCALPALRDPQQRYELTQELGEALACAIELRGDRMRDDCRQIARAALGHPSGLDLLVDVVKLFEGHEAARGFREAVAPGAPPEPPSIPLAPVFRDEDLDRVRGLLRRAEVWDLRWLQRQLARDLTHVVPERSTVVELFNSMLELTAQPDELPPVLLLVERVAERESPALAELLRAWNEDRARELGVLDALRSRREEAAELAASPMDVPQCLVIMVDPVRDGSEDIEVRHWVNRFPDRWAPHLQEDRRATLATLEDVVEGIILATVGSWDTRPGEPATHIEFLLPYSLLNHDVAWFRQRAGVLDTVVIGSRYCVHVRSLERMRMWARDGRLRTDWRQRWRSLATARAPLFPDPDASPSGWGVELIENQHLNAVVLHQPPVSGRGLAGLQAAIAQGVGLALWHANDDYSASARGILMVLSSNVPRLLPEQIRSLRSRAIADPASGEAVRHVVCLWDDPFRPVELEEEPA